MEIGIHKKAIEYLQSDPLKHLTTLKYLSLYHDNATVQLAEDISEWALSVTIPTRILTYDSTTYPNAEKAVFVNGTSERLKKELLDKLPDNSYILRLNEELDLYPLINRFNVSKENTFVSYSCLELPGISFDYISSRSEITEEAISIFIKNDYTEPELRKHFKNSALWFGLVKENKIKSACFIYQNYGDIWEIAGVRTLEKERNKGYAQTVVTSALKSILEKNYVPRYETEEKNTNSVNLALSLGMEEFLRIDHYLLRQ